MKDQTLWMIGGAIVLYALFSQQGASSGTVAGLAARTGLPPPKPMPRLLNSPERQMVANQGWGFGTDHRSRYNG